MTLGSNEGFFPHFYTSWAYTGIMAMIRFPDRLIEPCRVFCIGCNYGKHIKELGSTDKDRCIVFMKPGVCLVQPGVDIRIPRDRGMVHHEVELVVAIGREGDNIPRENALDHVSGITLGLDLTLRDVQARLKKDGHPWEMCKAFEQSAPLGDFVPYHSSIDLSDIPLTCRVNGMIRQNGNTCDMLFPVDRLIEILSKTWLLRKGDLIFTGTPEGVGPITEGDAITIESPLIGAFSWRIV